MDVHVGVAALHLRNEFCKVSDSTRAGCRRRTRDYVPCAPGPLSQNPVRRDDRAESVKENNHRSSDVRSATVNMRLCNIIDVGYHQHEVELCTACVEMKDGLTRGRGSYRWHFPTSREMRDEVGGLRDGRTRRDEASQYDQEDDIELFHFSFPFLILRLSDADQTYLGQQVRFNVL